ncbi:hypothetical protein ACFWCB_30330 [Streptomyces sp. NPDC060048]|uniref:hypothetical protein n=1 Tax=unclassified Streptomyces TaxID=2593676 RepID=UPI003690E015
MKSSNVIRTLATAGVLVAATVCGTGSSSATVTGTIYYSGTAAGTYSEFVGCRGWVDMGYEEGSGTPYARGSFVLGTSTRGTVCKGWLERRTSPSEPFVQVSATHTASDVTGWFYDGGDYQSRVCVGDKLYSTSYACIGFW